MNPLVVKMLGKALMLSAQQYAIGSVLMSSTYSVKNFSKDQVILDNAADALKNYFLVGFIWLLSNAMVLGATYGFNGVLAATVANAAVMAWIYYIYKKSFNEAAQMYNLKFPKIF
jgi:hypothetical protein